MRPHGRFAYWSCEKAALTLNLGLAALAAGSYCILTLAVRELPALASYIAKYTQKTDTRKINVHIWIITGGTQKITVCSTKFYGMLQYILRCAPVHFTFM